MTEQSGSVGECPQFRKLFRGCKFEPRYDEPSLKSVFSHGGWTTSSLKIDGKAASIEDVTPMKKYVRDVCVRCGKTVERTRP